MKILISFLAPASLLASSIVVLLSVPVAHGAVVEREAKYYEIGKTSGLPLFTQHIRMEDLAGGTRQSKSYLTDQKGDVVMREDTLIKDDKVIEQKVDQLQLKMSYELKVQDNQITFKTFKFDGEERKESEKPSSEKLTENFITGPVTETFINNQLAKLEAGKSVTAQFGIFDYQKTVGFEFSRNKKSGSENDAILAVTMRPASFWLDMLVDTIYIEFDKNIHRIVRYKGRTPVRTMVGGKLKPFDAEIIYSEIAPKK